MTPAADPGAGPGCCNGPSSSDLQDALRHYLGESDPDVPAVKALMKSGTPVLRPSQSPRHVFTCPDGCSHVLGDHSGVGKTVYYPVMHLQKRGFKTYLNNVSGRWPANTSPLFVMVHWRGSASVGRAAPSPEPRGLRFRRRPIPPPPPRRRHLDGRPRSGPRGHGFWITFYVCHGSE